MAAAHRRLQASCGGEVVGLSPAQVRYAERESRASERSPENADAMRLGKQLHASLASAEEEIHASESKLGPSLHEKEYKAGRTLPDGTTAPRDMWFAVDEPSLVRLREIARKGGLSYDTLAKRDGGYQWCGSFVAAHYSKAGMAPGLGAGLASTSKADRFFHYGGKWGTTYVRDPSVADSAPVAERYKPIREYHAAHGGERRWLDAKELAKNPRASLEPGMTLFTGGPSGGHGKHMTLVRGVQDVQLPAVAGQDARAIHVVQTAEGNMPGKFVGRGLHGFEEDRAVLKQRINELRKAPSAHPGKERLPELEALLDNVTWDVRAAAKPAPADFVKGEGITKEQYQALVKKEHSSARTVHRQ